MNKYRYNRRKKELLKKVVQSGENVLNSMKSEINFTNNEVSFCEFLFFRCGNDLDAIISALFAWSFIIIGIIIPIIFFIIQ